MISHVRPLVVLAALTASLVPSPARAETPAPSPVAPPPVLGAASPRDWPDFITDRQARGQNLLQYGYVPGRRVNRGLAIAGGCLFGGAYLLSGLVGSAGLDLEGDDAGAWMFLPVLGPIGWGASNGGSGMGNYLLFIDVLAQGSGIAMFAIGMHGQGGWERTFTLTPTASRDGAGLTARGTF